MKKSTILVRRAVAPMDSGSSASLLPANADAEAVLSKIPMGETLTVKLDRSRSNPQNKLYWGIISHVAAGVGYETNKALHKALLVELGYYDVVKLPSGKKLLDSNSTAFDAMSADEFQTYMEAAVRLICSHPKLLPGTNSDDLIDEVRAMLGDTMLADIPAEDLAEAQRRFDAGVPMPVAPTPPSPVQDAEPQRRAGAEQPAHIRRPGPWNATTNHCPHCPKQPNEFCDFICSSQQPDPAHRALESPQVPKAPIIAPGGDRLPLERKLHERLEKQ